LNCVNVDPDPAMRGRLFVCSDLGVHVTDNYGQSWSMLGTGMPSVVVTDLDLIESSRQLFAGTYGRSIYVYALNQLGPAGRDFGRCVRRRPTDAVLELGSTFGRVRHRTSGVARAPCGASRRGHVQFLYRRGYARAVGRGLRSSLRGHGVLLSRPGQKFLRHGELRFDER
jgi:hypothetical protein